MYTFNLFKRPFERSTLKEWAKLSDDVGKVAIIAIPAMIFSDYELIVKIINIIGLSAVAYSFLLIARNIRLHLEREN